MNDNLKIDNFKELIEDPLQKTDSQSYDFIKRFFKETRIGQQNPYSVLIQRLTGKSIPPRDAKTSWRHILENKKGMERKLGRTVGIQAAAIDFFETQQPSDFLAVPTLQAPDTAAKTGEEWIQKAYTPGYYLEKLKEEMLRAKRYKHALSSIMIDIDEFRKVNEVLGYEVGDRILTVVVKIIKRAIRTVDILTRYSGDRFMLILPNTNKREAMELAERLRASINEKTKRIEALPTGVTATLSVGQCSKDESSNDFLKKLESTLIEGKKSKRDFVYAM
ncbi:MAG: GGDEF domain-containing protein [Fibrobacter sp.]|nr:GGDEF domain-containing protein [Fibrobacter sp.]